MEETAEQTLQAVPAKVTRKLIMTVTCDDDEGDNGEVRIHIDFQPPISENDSTVGEIASHLINLIKKLSSGTDDDDDEPEVA